MTPKGHPKDTQRTPHSAPRGRAVLAAGATEPEHRVPRAAPAAPPFLSLPSPLLRSPPSPLLPFALPSPPPPAGLALFLLLFFLSFYFFSHIDAAGGREPARRTARARRWGRGWRQPRSTHGAPGPHRGAPGPRLGAPGPHHGANSRGEAAAERRSAAGQPRAIKQRSGPAEGRGKGQLLPRSPPGPLPLPIEHGGTDKLGRALLQVTTSGSAWGAAWCSAAELAKLLLCLCSLPRKDAKDSGLTAVVDARRQPPSPALFSALRSVQSVSPGCIHGVLLLADKELGAHRERLPGVQVETLTSLKALGRYVDSSQVTAELDGTFPYCHGEWVQFFQKLHPFTASLRRASELLQSCIQELRSADGLAGTQDAAACIGRHQELMRRVLSDPQLVRLQREGGAVLARLRREAARLSTSPHVRKQAAVPQEASCTKGTFPSSRYRQGKPKLKAGSAGGTGKPECLRAHHSNTRGLDGG